MLSKSVHTQQMQQSVLNVFVASKMVCKEPGMMCVKQETLVTKHFKVGIFLLCSFFNKIVSEKGGYFGSYGDTKFDGKA